MTTRSERLAGSLTLCPKKHVLEVRPTLRAYTYEHMNQFMLRSVLGWGFALWLIGYVLGFVLYAFVPPAQIGWYVMPLGIAVTLYVLVKKVAMQSWRDALTLGIGWSIIAMVCDYVGIVMLLNPADGYYKTDVYLYYLLTLLIPVAVYASRRG